MDLRWLQVNQATVSVDFKAHSLECLFFNSSFVIVISSCSKTNDFSVFFVDLVPEGLEVLEHDLVAFVHNENALSLVLNATNTNDVFQSSLRVWLSLLQDREQTFLLSFVTFPQTLIRIDHVNVRIRSGEN